MPTYLSTIQPIYIVSYTFFTLLNLPVALANSAALFMVFRFLSGFAGSAFCESQVIAQAGLNEQCRQHRAASMRQRRHGIISTRGPRSDYPFTSFSLQ